MSPLLMESAAMRRELFYVLKSLASTILYMRLTAFKSCFHSVAIFIALQSNSC